MTRKHKHRTAADTAQTGNGSFTLHSAHFEPMQRNEMVEQAAYYRAESRGFQPGHEMEDWLAAERDIEHLLARTDPDAFLVEASDRPE